MLRKLISVFSFICLFLSFSGNSFSYSQAEEVSVKNILEHGEKAKEEPTQGRLLSEEAIPLDQFDRGQPRSAIAGFLEAVENYDYALAVNYMDFRNLSKSTRDVGEEKLAKQLQLVIRRTMWVDLHAISDNPLGHLQDGLPAYRELIGTVDTPKGQIHLLLQRVPRKGDRVMIWKISNATVEKVPYLSQIYAYSEFGEWLSQQLPSYDILGVELWQWLYFLVLLVGYFVLANIVTYFISAMLRKFKPQLISEVHSFIRGPVTLLIAVIFARSFVVESNITLAAKAIMDGATILILAWIWFFVRLIDLLKQYLALYLASKDNQFAVYLLRPISTVLKLLFIFVGVLVWFENLGFSATTLLTGLGIGGLAIALAAQKSVENIIGAITLYVSAPVKIGNVCKFNNIFGVVEEIGLRATRIRTLDRTVVYIANAKFIDMQLENISERETIMYRPELLLKSDSDPDAIEQILSEIHALLNVHEKITEAPLRATLKGFTRFGLKLEVLAYVTTTDYQEFLTVTHRLNMDILRIIKKNHCQLTELSKQEFPVLDAN